MSEISLAAVAVAVVAAVFTTFGLGGGIVYLPLIYGLGASYRVAASTALLLNMLAGSAASIEYIRRRQAIGLIVWPAAAIGIALAPVAAFEAGRHDVRMLRWGVVVLLTLASLRLLLQADGVGEGGGRARGSGWPRRSIQVAGGAALGGANGVIAGLLGIGGGIVTSPVLLAAGVPPLRAAATTAPIVVAASAAGFLGHLTYGVVDLRWAALCAPAALIGGAIGSRVHRIGRVRPAFVKRAFGAVLAAAAALLGSITAGHPDPYDVDPLARTVVGIHRLAQGAGPGLSQETARSLEPIIEALVRLRRGGTLSPEAAAAARGPIDGFNEALCDALPAPHRAWLETMPTAVRDLKELSRAPFELEPGSAQPRIRDVPPLDPRRMRWWRTWNLIALEASGGVKRGAPMHLANRPPGGKAMEEARPLPIRVDPTTGELVVQQHFFQGAIDGITTLTILVDADGDRRISKSGDWSFRCSLDGRGPSLATQAAIGTYSGRLDDPELMADDQSLWRWSAATKPPLIDPAVARIFVQLDWARSSDTPQIGRVAWRWPLAASSRLDPATWGGIGALPGAGNRGAPQ